jgi:hypothetical protein
MLFKSGESVMLKIRAGRKVKEMLVVFQGMQTKSRAVVQVDPEVIDGEELQVVDVRSLRPYYNAPSDMERRAKHAARKFKQGVRAFRLNKPDGRTFWVETIDVDQGIAVGRQAKRKTVQIVALHSLFPEIR